MNRTQTPALAALRISVTGVVQGVGFRPFVHRLAARHGLCGWVRNDAGAVEISVEGSAEELQAFLRELEAEAPPISSIESVFAVPAAPTSAVEFAITESVDQPDRRQPVSPDVALCDQCEREMFDRSNRRYRYPFITCTDCGPRFTVIDSMPYDRERTSMRDFDQCTDCLAEYTNPASRRYHSESNSCPVCGPRLWFETSGEGRILEPDAALAVAVRLLATGHIVAVRGLGGFHLAVDATNDDAVQRLRDRKVREAKPFAVMIRTVEQARVLARLGEVEESLLRSPERPIVLVRARVGAGIAPAVSPGLDTLGLMTAYTPLHHLLLEAADRPLVMTSGNSSEEPIATDNRAARERLSGIADGFLMHDRNIVARYDDSVVRCIDGAPTFLRRARGYAPLPVDLPVATPQPLVAVGPHLKNTFTLACDDRAYVSQHVGDLENMETLDHFNDTLEAYRQLFRIEPMVAVHDRHPSYLSTRIAAEMGLDTIEVQHHHAHIAAVAGEHGVTDPVIGLAFDGTGYGDDGAVWGAEFLVADLVEYRRAAHLRYAPLPGGDVAARQPWRTALGYLSLEPHLAKSFEAAMRDIDPGRLTLVSQQVERNVNSPLASSMGRLFDAAAAVIGLRTRCAYEGQAAMELEALAGDLAADPIPIAVAAEEDGSLILDPLPLLAELGNMAAARVAPAVLAATFHESVAAGAAEVARSIRADEGISTIALGGGVFQNARLTRTLRQALEGDGFNVLQPRLMSPNDGGISYGQAVVAAATLKRSSER